MSHLLVPQQQQYAQDTMSYVRHYGRPDLFITFTCNPQWKEIKENLFEGQNPIDRHDIMARIFKLKLKALMDFIIKIKIFGEMRCYMCSLEWQKRNDGYPLYRRRSTEDNGKSITMHVSQEIEIDNRWIVPYSTILCKTFKAHINVKYCNSVKETKPNGSCCLKLVPKVSKNFALWV